VRDQFRVLLRDATLREGLDTPGVALSLDARLDVARALAAAGIEELELVAPARVEDDVPVARAVGDAGITLRRSGLVYANSDRVRRDVALAATAVDRVELLMPLSPRRPPHDLATKRSRLQSALDEARGLMSAVGAGFPNATEGDPDDVVRAATAAVEAGADRLTIYDTAGRGDPDAIRALIAAVTDAVSVPVVFHAHDDLGLATANAYAAVRAGAAGLDVTVNGLGDRAGNASLEQLAVLLATRGYATGIRLDALPGVSALVARLTGIAIHDLAPIVGRFAFAHRSPAHLQAPEVFEAVDPAVLGRARSLVGGQTS
jgi:homocitrate synthase NifV